ncbi:MAG: TRAP transporter substrate-binding protein DctP [Burkholderiales bacterium]|nr:TRAP transporter substrate-binding protein DctP [Burkholderiales bacterium]
MKTLSYALMVGMMVGSIAIAGDARAQSASTIRLSMVGAWKPSVSPAADIGIKYKDMVNQLSAGKIVIDFRGAADVVPVFDQPEALVRGVFDVWFGAPNYWAGIVPGGYVTEMSSFDIPDNGPGSELFQFMNKLFEAHGVHYLGHMTGTPGVGNHFMYTQKRVARIEDLKGMKIRVAPLTRFFVASLGAEPVTLPPGDIYLALERGTVEGITWPVFDGFSDYGWQRVTKFMIAHPLYRDGDAIVMNLQKWNALPEDAKQLMYRAAADTQKWSQGFVAEKQSEQIERIKAAGMALVEFTPQEAKRWEDTAREALWAHFKTVMRPEEYATARRLLGSK